MKGTTHLIAGVVIGSASALYYAVSPPHAIVLLATGALSALAPDLDHASLLTSKVSKAAKRLRSMVVIMSLLIIAIAAVLLAAELLPWPYAAAAAGLCLFAGQCFTKGVLRNSLVSLIGAAAVYYGWFSGSRWLLAAGCFLIVVPWLKHRGLSHTFFALGAWGGIGWLLQQETSLEGIASTALAGYLSHLLMDMMTPAGVKLLAPATGRTFRL